MKLSGVSILENRRENFKLNALFVVVLVLESKALYLQGMRCIVYDITIFRPYEYDKREFSNNSTHTLGARGFLCAVSGFGQVLKSDLRPCLRRSAEDVSATRGFSSQARKNLWYPTNSLCTDAPLPSEKIGERESLSPTFFF